MNKTVKLLIIFVFMGYCGISSVTGATTEEKFDALCLEILEALQSFEPVNSTSMGVHSYDHRLTDYSSRSVKDMIRKLKGYEKKIHKYKNSSLSTAGRVNYHLIKSNLDMALLDLDKIKWHKKSPQLYSMELVNGIYMLMNSGHAPLAERTHLIIARMKAVPGYLATARANLKTPPPILIEAGIETIESGIDFYQSVASELMQKFPEQADEILKVSTRAREAMNDYSVFLSEITPGDEHSFAIGKENFDYMLSHKYFLEIDTDSLIVIGEQLLTKWSDILDQHFLEMEENHQNGADSVFVPKSFNRQDILDYYKWEIEQTKIYVAGKDWVTIPDDIGELRVVETPPFLRTLVSGIAYQPAGPFDNEQVGIFYVRPIPEEMDAEELAVRYRYVHRRGFQGSIVHEAYPGHHLQLQIAARLDDPVRKWQLNAMLMEGWALYNEEMFYRAGFYGDDPAQWQRVLEGIVARACRIVADAKLHTGQFTVNEAIDWMCQAMGITNEGGRQFIAREMMRYSYTPTYQMAYLMGKREVFKLRKAVEARDGDEFSEKKFHDALLAEGSIPPALMWDIWGLQPVD